MAMSAQHTPLSTLSDTLRNEPPGARIWAIHAGTAVGILAELLAVLTVAAALHGYADPSVLLGWGGFMAAMAVVRLAISLHGRGRGDGALDPPSSRNLETITWCGAGFGWGIAMALFFPLDGLIREGLVLLVTCALVVLLLEVLQASRRATFAYAIPATVIPVIALLSTGEPGRIGLAALTSAFLGFIWYGFARRQRAYETALVTRLQNDRILDDLAASERTLRASIEEERLIFESALVGIAIVRGDRFVRCNRRMEQIFGFGRNELDGRPTAVIFSGVAGDAERLASGAINPDRVDAASHAKECAFRRREGGEVWCRYRGQIIDSDNPKQGSIWVFEDMTEQRAAAERMAQSEKRAAQAAAAAREANARLVDAISCVADAFALFDQDDRLVQCNQRYLDAIPGPPSLDAVHGKTFEELVLASIGNGEPLPVAYKRDPPAWVKLVMTKHRNPDSEDLVYEAVDGRWWQVRERRTSDHGVVTMKSDITYLKRREEEVRHLAHHDPLTGLPNRRLLDDRLMQALNMAQRSGLGVAVMLIDLDRFKLINDSHGHEIGDHVLQMVARKLKSTVRRVDTIARQGGDEFVVVLPELRRASDAARVANKILQQLEKPIVIDRHSFSVGASIGVALFPTDGADAEALLRQADTAMYRAKSAGSGRAVFVTLPPQQQELELQWTDATDHSDGAMHAVTDA